MSLFKRLLSADYRAAVSAEAAGQLEQAAEHYVLAGEHAEAVRIHLARAERAMSRADRIAALRDALHWAQGDATLGPRIYKRLGRVLLDQARDEGVATHRDRERVREAAEMLMLGGDFKTAGEALESIGDAQGAARAYTRGGLVERIEAVLTRDDERLGRERLVRDAFADYELHLRVGERDQAREALRRCVDAAEDKSEYRRLHDELESRLITGGVVSLRRRGQQPVTAVAAGSVGLGRDVLCELPLRAGGVSRRHAEIAIGAASATPRFHLRDAGSRNGTTIAGLPIAGAVPLTGEGSFGLGDQCSIEYRVIGEPAHLVLRVQSGLELGRVLVAGGPGEALEVSAALGVPVAVVFRDGRPHLERQGDVRVQLGGEVIARGGVQLIHGDELVIGGVEVDVT